jgi:hypothetical protein
MFFSSKSATIDKPLNRMEWTMVEENQDRAKILQERYKPRSSEKVALAQEAPRKSLNAAKFVELWEVCATLSDFIEKSGLSRKDVSARAAVYRKKGVKLKKFSETRKIDVDELNRVIDRIRQQQKKGQ